MDLFTDFRELLESFNAAGVECLLVGGYAMAAHGKPRFAGDIDLYVRAGIENGKRVVTALDRFGFGSVAMTRADFERPDVVVQLGNEPWRVDLLTRIDGVEWEEASRDAVTVDWGVPIRVIGREALIRNKRASGCAQDLLDAEALAQAGAQSGAQSGAQNDA